jgi:hypothetical protein
MAAAASAALGRPVRLAGFRTTAVAYEPGSPATGALLRVTGTTADGQPWSLFLKVLVPAFTDGLRAEGGQASAEEVAWGYVASLAVRAGFTSLPFERLAEPPTPALAATFRERAALTRLIADLALALP